VTATRAEMVGAAFDQLAADYDMAYSDPRSLAENDELRRQLTAVWPVNGSVVDVGCGTGLTLSLTQRLPGAEYLGVDLSAEMVRRAAKRFPFNKFRVGDAVRLSRPDACGGWLHRRFDLAVSLYAITNAPDPAGLVEAIGRLVRPGGAALVVTGGNLAGGGGEVYGLDWAKFGIPYQSSTPAELHSMFSRDFSRVEVFGWGALGRRWGGAALPRWAWRSSFGAERLLRVGRQWGAGRCYHLTVVARGRK
jgi:SAM-dependent methyltransferase